MAPKRPGYKVKLDSQMVVRKLLAAVSLLAFMVVIIASVQAGVGLYTVTFRAAIVMIALKALSVVVIRVLNTYEEMGSGQN